MSPGERGALREGTGQLKPPVREPLRNGGLGVCAVIGHTRKDHANKRNRMTKKWPNEE